MEIRPILLKEQPEAMDMVWKVFQETDAFGFSKEAINSFRALLHNDNQLRQLLIFGAFADNKIVGVLAIRNQKQIGLFFILQEYQKKGIGRAMFDYWLSRSHAEEVFVNASLPSVNFYRRLGFIPVGNELYKDGIHFLPMIYQRNQ